jgi:hypothetical protein
MVKRNKMKGASRPKNGKDDGHVRIRSQFTNTTNVSSASLVTSLGNISTAVSTGILANDVGLQSLTDMFRLYKINSIIFEFAPASGASTAAVEIPAGFLGYAPFGRASNPTGITDFETNLVSPMTVPFGTSTTTTAPLTRECGTKLALQHKDLPILQGSPGGWLATQDDGTQTNWGNLFWTIASATAANTIAYMLKTTFDISFKDLLDPTLISRNLNGRYQAGFPSHWTLDPESLIGQMHTAHLQRLSSSPLLPTPVTPPTISSDSDDSELALKELRISKLIAALKQKQ